MARLTLEKTFKTSFVEMGDPDPSASKKAFKDFNRRIKHLGSTRGLSEGDFRELMGSWTGQDRSLLMAEIGVGSLEEKDEAGFNLFLPGFSALVVSETGLVEGVYDQPNQDPTLSSFGPGLMWAALKVGQEKFTASRLSASSVTGAGYAEASEALTGEPELRNIQLADRHHIGGNSMLHYLNPQSSSMRALEARVVMAGVSGVLYAPAFIYKVCEDPEVLRIAQEGRVSGALDGFEGNLFAGSLDSTLAGRILVGLYDIPQEDSFADRAISDIKNRHAQGINPH